jgi:chromosomal replication initiation ATPase DnaA
MSNQHILPLTWQTRYDEASFIVADCNRHAYDLIANADQWSHPVCVLQGAQGSGKTHLAQIFQDKNAASLFVADVDHLIAKGASSFVLDDADRSAVDPEILFHLYNHVVATKGRWLITCTRSVAEWVVLPDLLSRLQSCPLVRLDMPDETMIAQAYQKLFTDRGLFVDDKVLAYLALRTERSFSAVLAIVDHLDKAALQTKRRVTIPLVQELGLFG